jgi:hypothetical protein
MEMYPSDGHGARRPGLWAKIPSLATGREVLLTTSPCGGPTATSDTGRTEAD